MHPLEACLLLRKIPQIGAIRAQQLVAHCGSPQAVFSTDPTELVAQKLLTKANYTHFIAWKKHRSSVAQEMASIEEHGWRCLIWGTPDYPPLLTLCPDAPLLLLARGQWPLNHPRIISVVGTRRPTDYGKRMCQQLIEALAPYNPLLVSGFAYGVDILAQTYAAQLGLATVGCMAQGLDRIYPAKHQKHLAAILAHGGLVSEFLPSDPFERTNFLRRNRIIAGLAHATVVIESGKRGGSMITAGYAHQYNREVFALPGPMDAEKSQGCLHLIEQQLAQVIGRPETIAHSLGWKTTAEKQSIKSPPTLREDQKTVYTYVAHHPQVSLDALALGLKQSVSQTAALLMELELLGCVQSLPGKRYRVC